MILRSSVIRGRKLKLCKNKLLCKVLHRSDSKLEWWYSCKDVSLLQVEHEEEREAVRMPTEGKCPQSEEHFKGFGVIDEVLKPLRMM